MKKIIVVILSLFSVFLSLTAQTNDTLPEPDRLAEDFVRVSMCIADPTEFKDDALGVVGHAFLRLKCDYYNLDYCFSYEGERVNYDIMKYLLGQTKMGMFAYPTNEYLEDYRKWNRSVHEYFLDLPPEAETRLWEIMDNHLAKAGSLKHDLYKYGCAITIVHFVKQALNGVQIQYAPNEFYELSNRREIAYQSLNNSPWIRLVGTLFTDNSYDAHCPIDEKVSVPADLAIIWQQASVDGRTLATYVGDVVKSDSPKDKKAWFTPMLCAILLLLITVAFAFTPYPYWDWLLIGVQAVVGVGMVFLWIVMSEFGSSAYFVLVLMNPIPVIFWKWRKYYGLIYSIILLVGVLVLALMPHILVDPSILVLAILYCIIYGKETIKELVTKNKRTYNVQAVNK